MYVNQLSFFDDKTRNIHSSASSKQKSPSRSGGLRAKLSQERKGEGGRLQDEGANWVSRWVDSQLLFLRSFSRAECRLSILSYGEKEDRETKWMAKFVSDYSESCACRTAMRHEPVRSSQLSNAVCLVHAPKRGLLDAATIMAPAASRKYSYPQDPALQ